MFRGLATPKLQLRRKSIFTDTRTTQDQPKWNSTSRANLFVRNRRKSPKSLISYSVTKPIFVTQKYLTTYQYFWTNLWSSNFQNFIDQHISHVKEALSKKKHLTDRNYLTTHFLLDRQRHIVTRFYTLYKLLVLRNVTKFSLYLQYLGKLEATHLYKIYFTFTLTRFYINLWDVQNRNYVSLSVGLFLKFFQSKRSLKKNRMFRLLLVRFFRKLLIISKIKNVIIVLKKTPRDTNEIFSYLNNPLPAPFFDPVIREHITESLTDYHKLEVRYLYFLKAVSFTNMKYRQKGRLKRKIARKVIKKNRITD